MAWKIVKFYNSEDDSAVYVEAVPASWIINENECFWPPYKTSHVQKAIKSCETPDKTTWNIHNIVLLSNKSYDKYSKANAKANRAQKFSDVERSEREDILPPKRSRIRNRFYRDEDSDDSTSSCASEVSRMIQNLPAVPSDNGLLC